VPRLRYQYRSGNDRSPAPVFVTQGCLRDTGGPYELPADAPNLPLLVPTLVRVKLNAEHGGQHLCGQVFRVITGLWP